MELEVALIPCQLVLICSQLSPLFFQLSEKAAQLVLSSSTSKHLVLPC